MVFHEPQFLWKIYFTCIFFYWTKTTKNYTWHTKIISTVKLISNHELLLRLAMVLKTYNGRWSLTKVINTTRRDTIVLPVTPTRYCHDNVAIILHVYTISKSGIATRRKDHNMPGMKEGQALTDHTEPGTVAVPTKTTGRLSRWRNIVNRLRRGWASLALTILVLATI